MHSRAPLIFAIVLLLLPVLYVGSYLALVRPNDGLLINGQWHNLYPALGSEKQDAATWLFWAVNQIDLAVRPGLWESALRGYDEAVYEVAE